MIEQTNTSKAIHVVGPTRQDRGRKIYEAGGQIRHVGDGSYTILSQTTPDTLYTLDRNGRGWNCSCPEGLSTVFYGWFM